MRLTLISGKSWFLLAMTAGMLLAGVYGFGLKFLELVHALRAEARANFVIVPIVIYLCNFLGFLLLFVWALLHGMLADIEGPKYRMLENEDQLEEETP